MFLTRLSAMSSSSRPKGPSAPIPIALRPKPAPRPDASGAPGKVFRSSSVPYAPVFGSLKAPSQLDALIPALELPPASPDAFSMVRTNPPRTKGCPGGGAEVVCRLFCRPITHRDATPFRRRRS